MGERTTPLVSLKKLNEAVAGLGASPTEKTIKILKELQEEHIHYEERYRREWNELKLKYLQLFRPLYDRRRGLLSSVVGSGTAGTAGSGTAGSGTAGSGTAGTATAGTAATATSSLEVSLLQGTPAVPGFWVRAMKNHVLLNEMVEVHDVPVLNSLEDVVFEWLDEREQSSFRLLFYFKKNDHFDNEVLTKTYYLEPSEEDDEESVLTKTEGTKISWKPGKNITEKVITRKQRNRRTNQVRTIREVVEENSFFNIFQTHVVPNAEALEAMEEREVTELEMIVEAEFEVGCIFRDKIIPRALGWYLGIERDNDVDSEAISASGRPEAAGFDDDDDDENESSDNDQDIIIDNNNLES